LAQLFLLRRAAQVLTLRGPVGARRGAAFSELGIIKDGSVLIRDGKIVSIGSARRIENLKEARGAIEISAEGAIVLPGFVDPGLQLNLNCIRSGSASPPKRRRMADFSDESLSLMRACLQHGTLNVQVKASAGGAGLRSDFAVLRHLAEIGNNPVGMVRSWRIAQPPLPQSAEAREFHELLSVLVNRKLVHAIEVAPECNETSGAPVWHAAAQRQIDVNLLWSAGSSASLQRLLVHANPHAVWCPSTLSNQECDVLSTSRPIAVFSPGSELLNGSGNDTARRLADSGAAIALSSGYHPCDTPSFNMQMAIALAVFGLRLTIEQAITAATINAAYAIRRSQVIGSIECGKRADLVVLDIPDYREIPRRFGSNNVVMAMRDGNIVFKRLRSKATVN
jgi:imidazolonepropionase